MHAKCILRKHKQVCLLAFDRRDLSNLLQIPAAEADADREIALGDEPLLRDNVSVAEVTAHKLKGDLLGLAGSQRDLLKAAELLNGCTFRRTVREGDLELGHCGALNIAGVGDRDGDVVDGFPEGRVTAWLDGLVGAGLGGDFVDDRGGGDVGDVKGGV